MAAARHRGCAAWNSRGAASKCACGRGGIAAVPAWAAAGIAGVPAACGRYAVASRRGRSTRHSGAAADRRGADRAQIAFDHRQPIDHMAERVVNGLERILGVTVGFRLAETDVGQFALDDVDQRRCPTDAARGLRPLSASAAKIACWCFEMAQDVLQPVLDPPEIAGAVIAGGFQPLEQIGHALFEMGESRRAVIADRHAVEALGQRPQRAFEMFRAFAGDRPLAAFQRRGQRGDALFEDRERIAVVSARAS